MEVRKCFICEENPRIDGDFMCRSCKEEHPMCYECGHRKRNLPFKFCENCYSERRSSDAGSMVSLSTSVLGATSTGVSQPGTNGNDKGNGSGGDGEDDRRTVEMMNLLSVESDSEGMKLLKCL